MRVQCAHVSSAFPSTRWTRILAVQHDPAERAQALRELLGVYWRPLYAFGRMKGLGAVEAEDAVQAFVVHLLERDPLLSLDPTRGRFRSYLRTSFKNFLANRRATERAAKRGGGKIHIPIDTGLVERRLAASDVDPEEMFMNEWARSAMAQALSMLDEEFHTEQRAGPWELIRDYFNAKELPPYSLVAAEYGMSTAQVKSLLHRARARFRAILRQVISETLPDPLDEQAIDDELGSVVEALRQ